MDESRDPGGLHGVEDMARGDRVGRLESSPATPFAHQGGRVNHRVRSAGPLTDSIRGGQVTRDDLGAERAERGGPLGPSDEAAEPIAASEKGFGDMPADETRGAGQEDVQVGRCSAPAPLEPISGVPYQGATEKALGM